MLLGECSPRSMPTATGKNARYAAISETDIQLGHSTPPQPTMSGASATSGHGLGQDHVWQQAALDDPEALHDHGQQQPDGHPDDEADRGDAEREQARRRRSRRQTGRPLPPATSGRANRRRIDSNGGMERSSARGRTRTPKTFVPSWLPTAL